MPINNEPKLLTTAQVAARLGQTEESVRGRLRSGELPGLKLGAGRRAHYRIIESEFKDWLYGAPSRRGVPSAVCGGWPLGSDRALGTPHSLGCVSKFLEHDGV